MAVLSKRSRELFAAGFELVRVDEAYQGGLERDPALLDLMGYAAETKEDLERGLRMGTYDDFGVDRAPYQRAALAVVEGILARPRVVRAFREKEEAEAGLALENTA